MIKIFSAAACLLLLSCNNDASTDTTGADSPSTQYRGVENVNGNIPDTIATGAEPSSNLHTDSIE